MNTVIRGAVNMLESRYESMPDEEIIRQIKTGHHPGDALFYLLFARYAEMLKIIYSRQTNTLLDFDDFMLELDIRLFRDDCIALRNFDPDKASFKTYLSTIARNLLFDLRQNDLPTLDVSPGDLAIVDNSEVEEVMWLIEEINCYPNKDSRYVLLKTIEGYKSKEIAAMLTSRRREEGTMAESDELKPSYIDTLRSRALASIRRKIALKTNLEEECCRPAPAMSTFCDFAISYMQEPKPRMSKRTPIPTPSNAPIFIQNILALYHTLIP